MDKVIKREVKLCPCCMETHEIDTLEKIDFNVFRGEEIEYKSTCEYCKNANVYYQTEEQLNESFEEMRKSYEKKVNGGD